MRNILTKREKIELATWTILIIGYIYIIAFGRTQTLTNELLSPNGMFLLFCFLNILPFVFKLSSLTGKWIEWLRKLVTTGVIIFALYFIIK